MPNGNLRNTIPYRGASYRRNNRIDHGGASAILAVCVIRTNFALTGAKVIAVIPGTPSPSATGALHVDPSEDTCTR